MTDELPTPHIESPHTGRFAPAVLVWLVPLGALAVAGFVSYKTLSERGPLITVSFGEASGVVAGETGLRYRDVEVGLVEEVGFTEELNRVLLSIRLDKEVADFADDDAEFWIVQPEVTTRGITGLNTVLSGVYLEANWDNEGEGVHSSFIGLDRAPLSAGNRDGLSFVLRTQREGGLTPDTPILYKGIEVGRVGTPRITDDGVAVEAPAFIDAPHDELITTATRFWDISGVRFSLGAQGAEIDFESIASLLSGGISFQTIVSGGDLPQDGTVFQVYPDEGTARNSVFEQGTREVLTLSLVFDQNVSGLETGAVVELNGIRVGEVTNLTGLVDEERFGDTRVRLVAVVDIGIGRLGLPEGSTQGDALAFLDEKVRDEGLRARLTNASLLTGGLKIELARVDDAPASTIAEAEPFPIFPTATADVEDMTASAEDVLRRVENLPVEELMESAIAFLNGATDLVRNEDLNGTPAAIRAILSDVDAVTGSDGIQALPAEVQALLASLQVAATEANGAIADLRGVVSDFDAAGLPEKAAGTLDAAQALATEATTVAEGLPALLDELQALTADARTIPFADLSARLDALLVSADDILTQDALAALPAEVSSTLSEAQGLAADLRGLISSDEVQALPPQASSLLTELQAAVGDLRTTLAGADAVTADISVAIAEVPALVEEFKTLATQAADIPFTELSARLDSLLATADRFLSDEALAALPAEVSTTLQEAQGLATELRRLAASDGVQQLPDRTAALLADMQGAVADLRTTLTDFQDRGTIDRLVEAVDSTTAAADSVTESVAGLPDLIAELQSVAGKAGDLPLAELTTELTDTLASVRTILAGPETQALPASLNAALDEFDALLADIRQGDILDNAASALAAAEGAATSVEGATASLPSLIQNANAVLTQANATLAGLDTSSELSREARSALREVTKAAAAVSALARTLERRPNSILLGR